MSDYYSGSTGSIPAMNTLLTISPHTVHLWLAELSTFLSDEPSLQTLLSPDEMKRAMRFRFPLHKQRFIISRSLLRKTISLYTGISPENIIFTYNDHGKPSLQQNNLSLQFNISHSADVAIFALTINQEIGVDIEKIEPHFKEKIAKRFFTPQEYLQLMSLSDDARINGFYHIWSKKEALIKALGQGLLTLLSDFSIDPSQAKQSVSFTYLEHPYHYYLESIQVPEEYQGAFATRERIERVVYKKCLV